MSGYAHGLGHKRWAPVPALIIGMALFCWTLTAAAQGPVIEQIKLNVQDAPWIEPTFHGITGWNVRIYRHQVGPGLGDSDAVYLFGEPIRLEADGAPSNSPVMILVDLESGQFTEFFGGKVARTGRTELPKDNLPRLPTLDGPGQAAPAPTLQWSKSWSWGKPTTMIQGSDRMAYLGTRPAENTKPAVVKFDPKAGAFAQIFELEAPVTALLRTEDKAVWSISGPGARVHYYEDHVTGLQDLGLLNAASRTAEGLVADSQGWLYSVIDSEPAQLVAFRRVQGKLHTETLLSQLRPSRIQLQTQGKQAWAQFSLTDGGNTSGQWYELQGGKATLLNRPPALTPRDYELDVQTDLPKPLVRWRKAGQDWKRIEVTYAKAGADVVASLTVGPDGKTIYGAGWPVAWIWKYDPAQGQLSHVGRDYHHYQLMTVGDRIYMLGYYGIKLLYWDPTQPWTFDHEKHFNPHSTPWGSRECNPQVLIKFRYLFHNNVRRPGGMALGADGRVYAGGHDLGPSLDGYRWPGGFYWFDPQSNTAGLETDNVGFEHTRVMDVASADKGRYIAVAGSPSFTWMTPRPPWLTSGMQSIWDTREHKWVYQGSANPGKSNLLVEEAQEGMIVWYCTGGPGDSIGSLHFFDTKQMKMVRIIGMNVKPTASSYSSMMRFERGPDQRIYFYGNDGQEAALFRVDGRTFKVEPVLRAKGITDGGKFADGATFCFAKDRVYFGFRGVWSLPINQVVIPAKP